MVAGTSVHHLSVHGYYTLETYHSAEGFGNAADGAADEVLRYAHLSQFHCCQMHLASYGAGTLNLSYLFLRLLAAQIHYGPYKFHRCAGFEFSAGDAQQLLKQQLVVVSVRRQKVHLSAFFQRLAHQRTQPAETICTVYSHLCGHVGHTLYAAIPYDVVNVNIIAEQVFHALVSINHTGQTLALLAEKIEERTVLPHPVGIGRVIGRAFVVTQQHYQAVAHLIPQRLAPHYISFFTKHTERFLTANIRKTPHTACKYPPVFITSAWQTAGD